MNDLLWLGFWSGVLVAGLAFVVLLRRTGVATTHARDVLHVGAGVWVLGWPAWREPMLPTALTMAAAASTALVPFAAKRWELAGRFASSVSDADERYSGLVHYAFAFAAFTWLGLSIEAYPAAVALFALSLGDGLGGAVGRRWGRHRYRIPGAKPKSLEGSVTVFLATAIATVLAALWFSVAPSLSAVIAIAVGAALAEALAPRSSDNLLVPTVVWLIATAVS